MPVRKVLTYPDPDLKKWSVEVKTFDEDLKSLIQDLQDTLEDLGGLGLAAPQIGVPLQVLVAVATDGSQIVLINPEIVQTSGTRIKTREGCLSVPGVYADISRESAVMYATYTAEGDYEHRTFEGRDAVVLQHEQDHLLGKLFIDRVAKVERNRLLRRYQKVKKRATKTRR